MILEQLIQLRTIVACNGSPELLEAIDELLEVQTIYKTSWNGT